MIGVHGPRDCGADMTGLRAIRTAGVVGWAAVCLAAAVCMAAAGCTSFERIDSWPLIATEPESEHLAGRAEFLGPLVEAQWKDETVQWGVRPLLSVRHYRKVPRDRVQFDVPFFAPSAVVRPSARRVPATTGDRTALQVYALYPFGQHESCEPMSRTTSFVYYNWRNRSEEAGEWHHWALLPLYLGGHTDRHGSYHAVMPFGGVVKNMGGWDTVRFVLFPLYVHTSSGGRESYTVLLFLNYASGGRRDKWHVWPFIGRSKRHDEPPGWFFLWPFFWYSEKPETGEQKVERTVLFPFFGRQTRGGVVRYNVLWPLFAYVHNRRTGRRDYTAPWPLVRFGNGPDYRRSQVWPFFGFLRDAHVRREYVLWPVYQRRVAETEERRTSSLSILTHRSITREWEGPRGAPRSDYENVVWPLWYYKRDSRHNTYFAALNLFVAAHAQNWDRFYSVIWRIVEHESRRTAPGTADDVWRSTRVLWGAFRYDRNADSSYLRLFPLVTTRREHGAFTSFEAAMGLFGFIDRPRRRTYRVLFVPWTVSRKGAE